jgi:hypothetical protein
MGGDRGARVRAPVCGDRMGSVPGDRVGSVCGDRMGRFCGDRVGRLICYTETRSTLDIFLHVD